MKELEDFCKENNIQLSTKIVAHQFHYLAVMPDGKILIRNSISKQDTEEFLKDIKAYLSAE